MFERFPSAYERLESGTQLSVHVAPFNKTFALSILDDTDYARYEYIKPVYDFLAELGAGITKTVWVIATTGPYGRTTDTTEREVYLECLKELQRQGFEIALHNVAGESSKRETTLRGYEIFKQHFGSYPSLNAPHAYNTENDELFNPDSDFFWADRLGPDFTRYWRANKFILDANTLNLYPLGRTLSRTGLARLLSGPRKGIWRKLSAALEEILRIDLVQLDQNNPRGHYLFWSSDGGHATEFFRLLNPASIERLADQGGVCLASTHLACGFCEMREGSEWVSTAPYEVGKSGWTEDGWDLEKQFRVSPLFVERINHVVNAGGWFVPTTTVLDRCLAIKRVKIRSQGSETTIVNTGREAIEGLALRIEHPRNISSIMVNGIFQCFLDDRGQFFLPPLHPGVAVRVQFEHGTWNTKIPRVTASPSCVLTAANYDGDTLKIAVREPGVVLIRKPGYLLPVTEPPVAGFTSNWLENEIRFQASPGLEYLVKSSGIIGLKPR